MAQATERGRERTGNGNDQSKSVRLNASVSCHFSAGNAKTKTKYKTISGICKGNNSLSKCNKKIRAMATRRNEKRIKNSEKHRDRDRKNRLSLGEVKLAKLSALYVYGLHRMSAP